MTWINDTVVFDAVLVWPTYPNMGIDDRNQLDLIRSMPGGIPGVRQMVADFHRRGVRVLLSRRAIPRTVPCLGIC